MPTETYLGTKNREYLRSHPWITFKTDMRRADPRLWLALGEAQSKCEHLAGVPLRPDTANELHTVFLAKGIAATTAIEGNTLTEQEVRDRIEGKGSLPPSKEYLGKEVDNILEATNQILDEIREGQMDSLSVEMINGFNKRILHDLEVPEEVIPGEIRDHTVGVSGYRGAPSPDCEYLLGRLCDWLQSDDFRVGDGEEIVCGILKAVIAHIYIAWIHPYGDGNGRAARLVEVKILLEAGVPSAAAHLLSNHYNLTRSEYYRQLQRASESGGDLIPFIQYALDGFVEQLKQQIDLVRAQQWDVTWVNFVHDHFRDKNSRTDTRRRYLALSISYLTEPILPSKIRRLTPQLAELYAGKHQKTVTRDLNALEEMGLVKKEELGYRAKREVILAFLPVRRMQ